MKLSLAIMALCGLAAAVALTMNRYEQGHERQLTPYAKRNLVEYAVRTGNPGDRVAHVSPSVLRAVMGTSASAYATASVRTNGECVDWTSQTATQHFPSVSSR